jgi:DNA modification methylase
MKKISCRKETLNRGSLSPTGGLPFPVEMVPLSKLHPADRNARTHSKKQIGQIAASMKRFGAINPVIIDEHGRIVAGHGRFEAAKSLGLKCYPVIRLTDLSETELRAYRLADNKLAQNAGWDREVLAHELSELQIALPEFDLDLAITGFDPGEVDSIMGDFAEGRAEPSDEIPELQASVTARAGDLFGLGRHRLIVGDARDEQTFVSLMQSDLAEMAFLDPPYNIQIDGYAAGHGRIKHREFACASGEMTSGQFVEFLEKTLGMCARFTIDGGISYVCMDWRHSTELLRAGASAYDELKNICVWTKTTPGLGSFYRSQHEFVFVYKRGKAPHLSSIQLGKNGRSRSNVWSYAGVNTFRSGRMDELKMHPTVKPVAMIADAMRDCSRRGSIVLDAFAGSGSTIMAAEQIGRRAYCIEIDPKYADVAIRRWQRVTGKDAVLESTGQTLEEMHATRTEQPQARRRTKR